MQITENTTGFLAAVNTWADPAGRDHCVVVVKGTFEVKAGGATLPAGEQRPFVFADEHHGDPGASSVRYECDFAPAKAEADVVVVGHAYAPGRRPATQTSVRLQVGTLAKDLQITGTRYWTQGLVGLTPTAPKPFTKVPLVYERAFGGSDHGHESPKHQGTELRNPVGVGFRSNPSPAAALGTFLPEIESPDEPLTRWDGAARPAGLGVIARGWMPRIKDAGTYDQKWLDQQAPFLPLDFDERHFQAAPADQRLGLLAGGEPVVCTGLSEDGVFQFDVPRVRVPVRFRLDDRDHDVNATLDTLLVEPDARRFVLTWRTRLAPGRRLTRVREIHVGPPPRASGKPHFPGLGAFVRWRRQQPGPA